MRQVSRVGKGKIWEISFTWQQQPSSVEIKARKAAAQNLSVDTELAVESPGERPRVCRACLLSRTTQETLSSCGRFGVPHHPRRILIFQVCVEVTNCRTTRSQKHRNINERGIDRQRGRAKIDRHRKTQKEAWGNGEKKKEQDRDKCKEGR